MSNAWTDFETYSDYVKARSAEGRQVLPQLLWRAIKENNPALVTRPIMNPART
jgi:hypothetical protein